MSKSRILWCKECGWFVSIPDGMCVNRCDKCRKHGLSFMEFSVEEWNVLERFFRERYGVHEPEESQEVEQSEDYPFGEFTVKTTFGEIAEGAEFGYDGDVYRKHTKYVTTPRCPNAVQVTRHPRYDIFNDDMSVLMRDPEEESSEEDYPMMCPKHGGPSWAEEHNVQHGFTCPCCHDGIPCGPGCTGHVTHPCENCGRQWKKPPCKECGR